MVTSGHAIKVIVFDLGKVLVDFDYSIAIRKLAARGDLSVGDFTRFVSSTPLLLDYESGKVTTEQFYDGVRAATGFRGDLQEFATLFGDIFAPIDPMIDLHRELSSRGFPTFIFSNTNDLAVRHIRNTFPFFGKFTGYVLSYEQGIMKPAPEFYRILEQRSGFQGPEIFYLDDRPENVEAGVARGWQAVVHQTPEQTIRHVRSLGLLDRAPDPSALR